MKIYPVYSSPADATVFHYSDNLNWINRLSLREAVETQQVFEYELGCVAWVEHHDIRWKEVSEFRYDEMLGVLPPAMWTSLGFLIGEPWDHHPIKGTPRYGAMVQIGDRFYEGMSAMDRLEFKYLASQDVIENLVPVEVPA